MEPLCRARAYILFGESHKAEAELKRAIDTTTDNPAILLAWSRIKAAQGHSIAAKALRDRAQQLAGAALAKSVNDPVAALTLAAIAGGEPPATLAETIRKKPDDAPGYRDRAEWHAEHAHWHDAVADYDQVLRIEPNSYYAMKLGLLLLKVGNLDRYRRHRQTMLDRWQSPRSPYDAADVLITLCLRPDPGRDYHQLAHLAEFAVSGDKNDDWYPLFVLSKALFDYRAGNFADLLGSAHELQESAVRTKGDRDALTASALLIEAMSRQRTADHDGARHCAARGEINA